MTPIVNSVDRSGGVLWITHGGRGDELAVNFRAYCLDYIPALRNGQIGIPFRTDLSADAFSVFQAAALKIVELLTARRGISTREEDDFFTNLIIVQSCRSKELEAAS